MKVQDRVTPILEALEGVCENAGYWSALCPAHDDHNPSLSIKLADDGRVLLNCFAGCAPEKVAEVLGVDSHGLCPSKDKSEAYVKNSGINPPNPEETLERSAPSSECTLEQYAEAKGLPEVFLSDLGLKDVTYKGGNAVRIPYVDEKGRETAVRFRLSVDGDHRFLWKRGSKLSLYGLWLVNRAREAGQVVLVEGESDCHTLWYHDIPALGIPGAATWKEEWSGVLDDIPNIYLVVEPDDGGDAVERWLADSNIRDRVSIVRLGQDKDPSGLYLSDPDHFPEAWKEALKSAIPWDTLAAEQAAVEQAKAWAQCEEIASRPNILDRVAADLVRLGVVGEDRAAKLVYLALTSRLCQRPVSVVVKGPSSGGKSYTVEQVLKFFPESAYYALTAMSERALAYSKEPLKHRFLVLYEAAGLGETASYLVRSLLSEGKIKYETVEKTKNGLQPRLIEREGPTGLLLTTTATNLHPENETRLLSISVNDTQAQTHKILLAMANEAPVEFEVGPWHALQKWLEKAEHRVTIPFATALAHKVPPVAVRLRRDFGAILNLIRAHAILHQVIRERDDKDQIIATVDDYAVVRDLVIDLIGDALEASVSPTIRQTVDAVRSLEKGVEISASLTEVAGVLKLEKGTTSRRVKIAVERGYLKNLQDKKGRPAELVLGDPMPDDLEVLPEPHSLM